MLLKVLAEDKKKKFKKSLFYSTHSTTQTRGTQQTLKNEGGIPTEDK